MQIINKLWMVLLVGGVCAGWVWCWHGFWHGRFLPFRVWISPIAWRIRLMRLVIVQSLMTRNNIVWRSALWRKMRRHVRCADLPANINTNINTGATLETQDPTPQDTFLSLHPCESTPFSPNCGAAFMKPPAKPVPSSALSPITQPPRNAVGLS